MAGIKSALLVLPDVPDELVYQMLEIIFSKEDALKGEHSAFKQVDFVHPLDGLSGAPLHPGAVKFFQDKGFDIPESLIP